MHSNDVFIVGAGLAGSILARKLAEKGHHILVVERRPHIGGNLYDEIDNGILYQRYGPHTFHTNNDYVISFVNKFAKFLEYHLKCETMIKNTLTPSPFNFETIDQFYDQNKGNALKGKLLIKYPEKRATILELLNDEDEDICSYARFLFSNDYSLYTSKQWGIKPEEVDSSVLRRVPVEFSYKDQYFYDKFEGVPKGGFTKFVENILRHPNIEIVTGKDAFSMISFSEDEVLANGKNVLVIFTGETDRLFSYRYGRLPYRSLRFEFERLPVKSYQPVAIVAYPTHSVKYTRITEYTKLPFQQAEDTIIAREYPVPYEKNNEPYYPVLTDKSKATAEKYIELARKYKNLVLVGRLAEFKYYNMDQVILHALEVADKLD